MIAETRRSRKSLDRRGAPESTAGPTLASAPRHQEMTCSAVSGNPGRPARAGAVQNGMSSSATSAWPEPPRPPVAAFALPRPPRGGA